MESLNLGILAHVDAGKTSLTDRLLYDAGVIDQLGSVDKGTTQTDTLNLERQRGITIRSAVVSFEVDDVSINLVDTPGHPDFIAEVERVLSVLDGAVLVVSAVEGVQAQTRILMRALQRLTIPTLIFGNKIDRPGADEVRTLQSIAERLTPDIVSMGSTTAIGTRQAGFLRHDPSDAEFLESAAEVLARHDDQLLARLLSSEHTPTSETLWPKLTAQSKVARSHPVYFGSALTGAGVDALTSALTQLLPTVSSNSHDPASGTVFKIERDNAGQRVAYMRMFSGEIRNREQLHLSGHDDAAKVLGIEVFEHGSVELRSSVVAGQIAKLRGLRDIQIGDEIGQSARRAAAQQFAPPTLEIAVVARHRSDKVALLRALDQLSEQDPLISVRHDERGQVSICLYGEVQKEVIRDTLATDFGLEVEFRRTSALNVERPLDVGQAREVLYRNGNPFLATIGLRVEPGAPGSGVGLDVDVKVESTPRYVYKSVDEFRNALDRVIRETLQQGLYGWEVIDCKVTVVECGYTAPGTKASDFRLLTPLVLMAALRRAGTVVCEPISTVRVDIPTQAVASTSAALARSRGTIHKSEVGRTSAVLEADVPAFNVHEFRQQLPTLTSGEGVLESVFARYEPVRGAAPTRPRTDHNPLNREEYLIRVTRRGRRGQGPAQS